MLQVTKHQLFCSSSVANFGVVCRAMRETIFAVSSGFFLSPKYLEVNMYEDLQKHILYVCLSVPRVFLSQPAGFDLPIKSCSDRAPSVTRVHSNSSERLQTCNGVFVQNLAHNT